jgi:hypothetical protein
VAIQGKPGIVVMESFFGKEPPLTFCLACEKRIVVACDGQRDVDPCSNLVIIFSSPNRERVAEP